MQTITVTAWHPYPQFRWRYKLASSGGWLDIETYPPYVTGGSGQGENSITFDDPQAGDEATIHCIVGNPVATEADMQNDDVDTANTRVSDNVSVTINNLAWAPNLESGVRKTVEAEPEIGTTIWVRPPGATYGDSSGTSYDNAISGWGNLVWDNIDPGDTIAIAGTHVATETSYVIDGNMIRLLKNDITLDGGLQAGDEAIIWGAFFQDDPDGVQPGTGNWSDQGSGVFLQTTNGITLTSALGVYCEIDLVERGNFTRLALLPDRASLDTFTPTVQSSGVEGLGGYFIDGNNVYVKMPDQANPGDRIIYQTHTARGYKLADTSDITGKVFKNITMRGATFRHKYDSNQGHTTMFSDLLLDNIVFDAVWGGWAIDNGFNAIICPRGAPTENLTIRNCTFSRYLSGIYHEATESTHTMTNVLIEGCTFRDFSNEYTDKLWAQWPDVHGIGLQASTSIIVDKCHFHDIDGNALDFHPWGGVQPSGTLTVTNCLVEDIRYWEENGKEVVAPGTGLVIEHSMSEHYDSPGKITFASNIIRRCDRVGLNPNYRGPLDVFNNTVYDCGQVNVRLPCSVKFEVNYTTPSTTRARDFDLRMFNNYISSPEGVYALRIRSNGNAETNAYIDLDNNYYFAPRSIECSALGSTNFFDTFNGNNGGQTFPEFLATLGTSNIVVASSELNSAAADPALDNALVPMGLTFPVDAANATHAPPTDYHGNARVNAPDIGAVERQTGNSAQAPDWTAPDAIDLPATLSHDGANDPLVVGPHYPAGAAVTHQWQEFNDPSWDNLAGQTTDTLNVADTEPYIGDWVVRDLATSSGQSTPSSSLTITVTGTPPSEDTPEALAVVARLKSVSGDSNMDAGEERAILDFVNTCVADSNWALLDEMFCLGTSEQYSLIGWKEDQLTKNLVSHSYDARGTGWKSVIRPTQSSAYLQTGITLDAYSGGNYKTGDAFWAFMWTAAGGWDMAANADTYPATGIFGGVETTDVHCHSREGDNGQPGGQNFSYWDINQASYNNGAYSGHHSINGFPDEVFACYDDGNANLLKSGIAWGTGTPAASSPVRAATVALMGRQGGTSNTTSMFMFALGGHSGFDHVAFNTACKQLATDLQALP